MNIWSGLFGLAAAALLSSCAVSVQPDGDRVEDSMNRCLVVTKADWDDPILQRAIVGEARNECEVTIGRAFVNFNVFDGGGAQIQSTLDSTSNLGAGEVWRFRAPVTNPAAHTFMQSKVNAYK